MARLWIKVYVARLANTACLLVEGLYDTAAQQMGAAPGRRRQAQKAG